MRLVERTTLLALLAACACGDDPDGPLRAVVLSDLNGPTGSTTYPIEVAQAVALVRAELRPHVVLIPGDMVAGQSPALSDDEVRAMWDAFDATVAAPLRAAGIPIVVTLGNHDGAAHPRHARDRRLAVEYWRERTGRNGLPFVERAHYPHRYTVRFGDVFIAVWDATSGAAGEDDDLVEWLEEALDRDEAREAEHRVVLAHVPVHDVSEPPHYPDGTLAGGDRLRRKLERWGATMMVTGHHHAYYPGRRGPLELLHAGSLGTYPRALNAEGAVPLKSIAMLDFYDDSVRVTGLAIDSTSGSATPIALETLPRAICTPTGWVARRDLVALDTSCARPSWWRRILRF